MKQPFLICRILAARKLGEDLDEVCPEVAGIRAVRLYLMGKITTHCEEIKIKDFEGLHVLEPNEDLEIVFFKDRKKAVLKRIDSLVSDKQVEVRRSIAKSSVATKEYLDILSKDTDINVRKRVARNSKLSAEGRQRLAIRKETSFCVLLNSQCQNCDLYLIYDLYSEMNQKHKIIQRIEQNERLRGFMVYAESAEYRQEIAKSRYLTQQEVEAIFLFGDEIAQKNIIRNARISLSVKIIENILSMTGNSLKELLSKRGDLDDSTVNALYEDGDIVVLRKLCKNRNISLTYSRMRIIAESCDPEAVYLMMQRKPKLPKDVRTIILLTGTEGEYERMQSSAFGF
jgi:hypothetical protein